MPAEFERTRTPEDREGLLGHTPEDEVLIRDLAADPKIALGAIYDRYGALVYGLARTILTSPDEAEDVTQETFLGLYNNYRHYDPARGSLPTFLVAMARSRALDRLRARSRRSALLNRWHDAVVLASVASDPHTQTSLEQTRQRVRDALAALPTEQGRVLNLAYYKGLTQVEISTHLGVPLGTVKSWMRRGLFALRDTLGDLVGLP